MMQYGCYVKIPFINANGVTLKSQTQNIYVTGIPCEANFMEGSYDGWSWSSNSYVGIYTPTLSSTSYLRLDTSTTASERNVAIYSPTFYIAKAIEPVNVTTSIAATSRNVDYNFIGPRDYVWYRNAYIETGTKSSAAQNTSGVYITASYSVDADSNADYVDSANVFGLTESKPCLVYSKYFKIHDQYINKIRIQYSGN